MEYKFEEITEKHRKEVIDIFNYYIKNTTAAYREEVVDYSFFNNLIEDCIGDSKYVIKNTEEVVGFCLLEHFIPLNTFREVAEVTYFIKKDYVGKGIGKSALERLENDAIAKGINVLTANITSNNNQSIRFHEKNGFTKYGELEKAGLKFDKYFNIIYMSKELS